MRIAGHTYKAVLQFNTNTQGNALLHALADIPLWNTNYIWYFPEALSVSVQRVLRRRATLYSGDTWIQRNGGQPRNVQHDYSALLRCRSTWGDEHFPLVDSKETIRKSPGISSNSFAKVVRTSPRATASTGDSQACYRHVTCNSTDTEASYGRTGPQAAASSAEGWANHYNSRGHACSAPNATACGKEALSSAKGGL